MTRPNADDVFTLSDGKGPDATLTVTEVVGEEVRGWVEYATKPRPTKQPYKTNIEQWKETWL